MKMMPSAILNHEIHEEEEGRVDIPGEEQPPHPVLQDLGARFVAALHDLTAFLGRLLLEDGDGVLSPQPSLHFTITCLFAFVAIKSQGHPDFPYQTNPNLVLAAVTCVAMFGFASAAEHIATRVDQPPLINFTGIARTGKILCLFLLVMILTYLSCS